MLFWFSHTGHFAEMAEGRSGSAQGERLVVHNDRWVGLFAKVVIDGTSVEAMIDTGSSHTFMVR